MGPPSSSSAGRASSRPALPGTFGQGSPLEGQSFETIADKLKDNSLGASSSQLQPRPARAHLAHLDPTRT